MNVAAARTVAQEWVQSERESLRGFAGAFLVGSTNDLPDDAVLDATSDLDIMIVLETADIPVKPGKFRYRDVLLEVSYLDLDFLRSADQVLGHYHLGNAITSARILADPLAHLTPLQDEVRRHFADRAWIERRTQQAAETVLARLDSIRQEQPLEEQVMAWLFAVGGLPHVLLVAGLCNPTVRKRYVAARDLLLETGDHMPIYEEMLDLLDPLRVPADRMRHHLDVLAEVFDATGAVVRSPLFFASDLSAEARPLAIDGSRNLIEAGMHREALFWIVATFCRCQIVLHADATDQVAHRWDRAFRELLADLDIDFTTDLRRRGDDVRSALSEICDIAARIIDLVDPRQYRV